MGRLRELAANDPAAARRVAEAGLASARATATLVGVGARAGLGSVGGAAIGKCFYDPPPYYADCPGGYWYPWGFGLDSYGSNFCFSLGFGHTWWPYGGYASCWPWYGWCSNFAFQVSWGWGSWYACHPWNYYCSWPVVYSSVYVPYSYSSPSAVYVNSAPSYADGYDAGFHAGLQAVPAAEPVGDAVLAQAPESSSTSSGTPSFGSAAPAARPETLSSAAQHYLEQGDGAFRANRFDEAVQHYARALEQAPASAVLHLVLSDALFATRDYHYAAYALRRALDLDPSLADASVDKHSFYSDPADFDRQLAQLELFVKDNPGDADARLVLAANYLYGGRAQAAVELLTAPATGRADSTARLILERAQQAQFGPTSPAPAPSVEVAPAGRSA